MIRKTLYLTILILCAASLAQAQADLTRGKVYSRTGKWDYSFQTHYIGANDVSGEGGSSLSFQDNLGWGFGFYYNFNTKFSLGVDFGWQSIHYTAVTVDGADPSHTETYSNKLDTSKFGLAGNWNILPGRYTPYVNAGIAWGMVDTNIFAGWGSGCYYDPIFGYICGTYPATYGTDTTVYNIGLPNSGPNRKTAGQPAIGAIIPPWPNSTGGDPTFINYKTPPSGPLLLEH
jgi:opacity protein-like surface antigen